jgi:hypothetical protein
MPKHTPTIPRQELEDTADLLVAESRQARRAMGENWCELCGTTVPSESFLGHATMHCALLLAVLGAKADLLLEELRANKPTTTPGKEKR